jgi:dephospho-CoA kinase
LLFEGNYENQFDEVIVVLRNKEARVHSIMARDNVTKEDALNRIAMQFDYDNGENRFKNCNAILVENNGALSDLKSKILAIVKQLS